MSKLAALLSGILMPICLLALGVYFACLLCRFFLAHPRKCLSGLHSGAGGASSWRRLAVALGGTLGVGNITGVALAIYCGGAGAVFWMWISAILAAFLKYGEILLAHDSRRWGRDGKWHGGAMYYMKDLLGKRTGKCLAAVFSFLCICASLTLGTVIQASAAADALEGALCFPRAATGVLFSVCVFAVLRAGGGWIERVNVLLVPLLCAVFLGASAVALVLQRDALGAAFRAIFSQAFSPRSGVFGGLGFLVSDSFRFGVARGLISNEAGCGTSPIAHAGAAVQAPAQQGLFGILEVLVDTLLLCTVTALVLLSSGVLPTEGSGYAVAAYGAALGGHFAPVLAMLIVLFAFATILSWAHYGQECVAYFGRSGRRGFVAMVSACAFLGAVFAPGPLWELTDILLAVMTLLNLGAMLLGRKRILAHTRDYFKSKRAP